MSIITSSNILIIQGILTGSFILLGLAHEDALAAKVGVRVHPDGNHCAPVQGRRTLLQGGRSYPRPLGGTPAHSPALVRALVPGPRSNSAALPLFGRLIPLIR